MISVDKVIEANLPQLENSPKVKGLVKKGLGYLLHEQEFVAFADTYPHGVRVARAAEKRRLQQEIE